MRNFKDLSPIVKWAGGKEQELKYILPNMPSVFSRFIEPFVGGGAVLFDVLAFVNKFKKNGKEAILKFSKWTLTEEMVGDTHVGEMSFKQYIFDSFKK